MEMVMRAGVLNEPHRDPLKMDVMESRLENSMAELASLIGQITSVADRFRGEEPRGDTGHRPPPPPPHDCVLDRLDARLCELERLLETLRCETTRLLEL